MNNKSTKSTKRKRTCHHCKSKYTPSRTDQKYCSDTCRYSARTEKQSKTNQKKIERRVSRLRRTGFGQYLVRECMRAGSVQILTGHTPDTLHELDNLRTSCFISNGVSLSGELHKAYELSHICPVNGHSIVGLLHPHNLVIASKSFNRERGKRYMGGGKWVERKSLSPQWQVDTETAVSQVYTKIERFLGQTLKDYLNEHNPKLSYKHRLINKIIKHSFTSQCFSSKEERRTWEDKARRTLSNLSAEELEQKVIERNLSVSSFNRSTVRYLPLMMSEVERFQSYGVTIDPTFNAFAEYLYKLDFEGWTGDYILEVDSNDIQENEWAAPSIQYWMAEQLCSLLHKEKPEHTFNGKHYTECFNLPEYVSRCWQPNHRIEEWKLAQHGRPPEPPTPPKPIYSVSIDDNVLLPWEEPDYISDPLPIKQVSLESIDCPF
ncbi:MULTISPECIES: hypothetical protein [Pseudomonadaceae]|uniref:hypothetical protein n=1 Tax=Pseudomonadaceae TaxID=135621 RepID=UPI001112F94E|nr:MULTISPECIES: hypothetical protein [Pseudomonas]